MKFRHHPDGVIYLADLALPLAFFQQQEPDYALPDGAIGREYVPGARHTLSDGSNQWGGELPWLEGDRYLANIEVYRAANQPPPTPVPAPVPQWDAFRTKMLSDPKYQQIAIGVMMSAQGDWLLTTFQDIVSMPAPSIALFRPQWNQIMSLAPIKPLPADVVRWQNNADSSGVSIKFLANGAIE